MNDTHNTPLEPRTSYGHSLVREAAAVSTMVTAQLRAYGDELPDSIREAFALIETSVSRAARAMLQDEADLTAQGMRKRWGTYVGPRFHDSMTDVEGMLAGVERQIAQSEEAAATVTLPPVTGYDAVIREMRFREIRDGARDIERRSPGALFASAMSAAATGENDELLVAIENAPRESGLRLPDDQRAAVRLALIERRAPHLGTANMHASVLTSVLQRARAFAKTAARSDA